jgi:ribosomal protein S13
MPDKTTIPHQNSKDIALKIIGPASLNALLSPSVHQCKIISSIEGELRSEVSLNIKRLMDMVVIEVSVIELVFL